MEARSNLGNFGSWRSWYPVFSLLGIWNPTNDWNLQYALLSRNPESSAWSPKSTAWNSDSKTVMRRNQRHCFREPWKERPVPLKKLPLHYIKVILICVAFFLSLVLLCGLNNQSPKATTLFCLFSLFVFILVLRVWYLVSGSLRCSRLTHSSKPLI